MKKAAAFANNDVAFVAWRYDEKIEGCLGFAIYRTDVKTGEKKALPAWVGFKTESNTNWTPKDTSVWPVQKFSWRDLTARRGDSYVYEIVPMTGKPGRLQPLNSGYVLTSNQVDLSPEAGCVKAYFNRGILSTQHVSHNLPSFPSGGPDYKVLKDRIDQPGDPLRVSLAGQSVEALSLLLNRAKNEGGKCYFALYELNDTELVKLLLDCTGYFEIVLSNTGEDDATNEAARQALHEAGAEAITDRMLKTGHIGHNKFAVYADKDGTPRSVLSGSTNWTVTGLCAQSNNAIVIENPELAAVYMDYWQRLKKDGSAQAPAFRAKNNKKIAPINTGSGTVDVWFSPNTKQQTKPAKNADEPSDFAEVAELIANARQAVLFLVFQPGTPCVVDCVSELKNNKPEIFVRGAATDPKVANDFTVNLYHRSADDPDPVVAASAVKDQFGSWQRELLKASPGAHAIIHDKVVVIDPLSDNCAVITGSHNLGYRASYNNDENLLIIRGNRRLAEAYAVHVMDIYDHYRWRYRLEKARGGAKAFYGLDTEDKWQDKYFKSGSLESIDLGFWTKK